MTEPWIAMCRLRALTPDKRRWDGVSDIGQGLLVTQAHSSANYTDKIREKVEAKGYRLEMVEDASPLQLAASYVEHRVEIDESYWEIQSKGLLLVGGFYPVITGPKCVETTWDRLLATSADPLWAVIDGVNWPDAFAVLDGRLDAVCLYASPDPSIRAAAPWLVRLTDDSPVTTLFKACPHERHSGILFQSTWAMDDLRTYLRKFTMIWTPADKNAPIYFRFYDPRVLLDMVTALNRKNWEAFTKPFSRVGVQLSALCVLPDGAVINDPVDIFDPDARCHSRLVAVDCSSCEDVTLKFSLSNAEFDAFGACQMKRSVLLMARELFKKMGHNHDKAACLHAAQQAPGIATRFDMKSKKQHHLIARCILIVGTGFPDSYPDAVSILSEPNSFAWQRKDKLQKWLVKSGVDAGQLARATQARAT